MVSSWCAAACLARPSPPHPPSPQTPTPHTPRSQLCFSPTSPFSLSCLSRLSPSSPPLSLSLSRHHFVSLARHLITLFSPSNPPRCNTHTRAHTHQQTSASCPSLSLSPLRPTSALADWCVSPYWYWLLPAGEAQPCHLINALQWEEGRSGGGGGACARHTAQQQQQPSALAALHEALAWGWDDLQTAAAAADTEAHRRTMRPFSSLAEPRRSLPKNNFKKKKKHPQATPRAPP